MPTRRAVVPASRSSAFHSESVSKKDKAMASSKVAVCNNALGELGEKAITSLSDAKESARLCNLFFDDVVRFVLREHDWGSASKRQQLSRLAAAPDFGFAYQ